MTEKGRKVILSILDRTDSAINAIVRIAMIPVLVCGGYVLTDTMGIYADASPSQVANYKPERIDAETLRSISENCVAWIQLDGTTVDYPIMQAENNTKYLNRDPYGNYSLSGSVFMDYRNSSDFSDEYTIIYGHHMSGGLMFGALDAYTDESYMREHLTGTLMAGDERYDIRVHAFFRCDASHNEVFSPYDGLTEERLRFFEQQAWHTSGRAGSKMIALTTCKSPGATDRTVLLANITKKGD
jgi:sortase B